MDRSDWLLLLLAPEALGVEGPAELDPVRIQKGMFLLSMRGPARDLYSFRPYNWGPFSPSIYGDLDGLQAQGLVHVARQLGQSWSSYSVTQRGAEVAKQLSAQLSEVDRRFMAETRRFLTSRTFAQLLNDVYAAYPDYATRSLLRR